MTFADHTRWPVISGSNQNTVIAWLTAADVMHFHATGIPVTRETATRWTIGRERLFQAENK